MTALVVDNSLVLYALLEGEGNDLLHRRLASPRTLHAPSLIDYEFSHALRGLVLGRKVDSGIAMAVRADFAALPVIRYPGTVTAERTWELRDNFTAYDASYIALAELLECPLLTGDAKLMGPHSAQVEVLPV